jgi:hypothetical protein
MSNRRALPIILLSTAFLLVIVCLSFARTSHREYKDAKMEDCRECHGGSGVADNHGAFFVSEHRLLAQKASSNCADCHPQSYCLDCHNGGNVDTGLRNSVSRRGEYMPRTHRSDFISIHPIKASDNLQNCYRCHEAAFCSDCHNRQIQRNRAGMRFKGFNGRADHIPVFDSPGVLNAGWVSFHSGEARRNLQSCQSCHPQKADCTNFLCHPNLGGR